MLNGVGSGRERVLRSSRLSLIGSRFLGSGAGSSIFTAFGPRAGAAFNNGSGLALGCGANVGEAGEDAGVGVGVGAAGAGPAGSPPSKPKAVAGELVASPSNDVDWV